MILKPLEKEGARKSWKLPLLMLKGRFWLNEYYNDYRWHKLTVAARHIGYRFDGDPHRALADCQATRAVWQHMELETVF